MNIRCVAIDDEPVALEKLKNYINRVPYLDLIAVCDGAIEATKILKEEHVDAIFIDINMPDINGLEFIASLSQCPLVVFTTAYSDYAVESYKVAAVDYLLKPYGFVDFQRAADRLRLQHELLVQSRISVDKKDSLFVRMDYKWIRIATDSIRYIQGLSDYLRIYLLDSSKPILTLSTFSQIMTNLPSNFLQVHRSYVVNMEQIVEVERFRIVMDSDTYIPIGDSFRDDFMKYLQVRSVGKASKQLKKG